MVAEFIVHEAKGTTATRLRLTRRKKIDGV